MKESIRRILDDIYKNSDLLAENFGDAILDELTVHFKEYGYPITKENIIEVMLFCYQIRMQ